MFVADTKSQKLYDAEGIVAPDCMISINVESLRDFWIIVKSYDFYKRGIPSGFLDHHDCYRNEMMRIRVFLLNPERIPRL